MFTIQFKAHARGATFLSQHPRARGERWVVSHVLAVATREIGAPVALVILMKSGDPLIHVVAVRTTCVSRWVVRIARLSENPALLARTRCSCASGKSAATSE